MKNHLSAFAIPSAIALLFASVGVTAQDKPNPASSKKSGATVSVSKESRPTVRMQAPSNGNGVAAKGVGERTAAQRGTPDAAPVTPTAERSYGGCHDDKDSDA